MDFRHSDKYTHCLNQDPIPTPLAIPDKARVRQFHADNLDFPGSDIEPDIAAPSSHSIMQISSPAPAETERAVKREQKTKRKPAKGKHSLRLPNNVYIGSAAGGRGRAKVGGAGASAGACILM